MNYGFKLGASCLITSLIAFLILGGVGMATGMHLRVRIMTVIAVVGIVGYILLITSLTVNRVRFHANNKKTYMIILWVLFEFVMLYLMIVVIAPLIALMPFEEVVENGLKIDYLIEGLSPTIHPEYNLFFYK